MSRLRQPLRIRWGGDGLNSARSEHEAYDALVLLLRLIALNRRRARAVSDQDNLLEASLLGKADPRGKVVHLFMGTPK